MVNGLSLTSMDSSAWGVRAGGVGSRTEVDGQGCSLRVGAGVLGGDGGSRLCQCSATATGRPKVCSGGWGAKDHLEAARHLFSMLSPSSRTPCSARLFLSSSDRGSKGWKGQVLGRGAPV